jgi:hypothetical protein
LTAPIAVQPCRETSHRFESALSGCCKRQNHPRVPSGAQGLSNKSCLWASSGPPVGTRKKWEIRGLGQVLAGLAHDVPIAGHGIRYPPTQRHEHPEKPRGWCPTPFNPPAEAGGYHPSTHLAVRHSASAAQVRPFQVCWETSTRPGLLRCKYSGDAHTEAQCRRRRGEKYPTASHLNVIQSKQGREWIC